jgi:hypothetical protein
MSFSSCKIPRHKKADGSYLFSDALPLLLRTHITQDRWFVFVHTLNRYRPRKFTTTDIVAGVSILAMFSVLCGAVFGVALSATAGQAGVVAFFSFVLLVIFNVSSEQVDWFAYMLHLADACNYMNKDAVMTNAEVVLCEDGSVVVNIQTK